MQSEAVRSHWLARYLGLMSSVAALVMASDASAGALCSRSFDAGPLPNSIVVADLDADSVPDVVVSNGFVGTVSVLLGNGDGSFRSAVSFAAGENLESIAVADLNGDDVPDLVAVTGGSSFPTRSPSTCR